MADFGDPYAAAATNPYLQMMQPQAPDWRMILANAATGIGAGISQGAGSNAGWAAGIAPGLMMGLQLTGQQQQNAQQQEMKRWQLGMMAQEHADKRRERALKERQYQDAANEYAPGMRAPQQSAVRMGPQSYDTKLAGYEGGTKNGGMVFNELGSGAYGPFQFMPATWAGLRAKNPNLNLPADMTMPGATDEERLKVHKVAHDAFKAENAAALQSAGFQPTPENLYYAHRFGAGGATTFLRADPNKLLGEVLPLDWQRQNPDMRGQTVGGFRRLGAERMQGVGVPYEAPPNAQPTQYALQPNALPSFDDPTLSLAPRPNSRFMPGVLPNTDQAPNVTAPVMPQPQGQQGVVPAQFTPPPAAAQAPTSDGPPKLVLPPKPELPAEEAVRIRRALMQRTMTPDEARKEKNRIENDLWGAHKDQAKAQHTADLKVWEVQQEERRFNRGQEAGEWQVLDPKNAQMKLGPGYKEGNAYLINKKGEIKPVGGSLVTVNTGDTLLPGQKKVDEKFADQYIEFVSAGGFADSAKMLNQLKEVQTALKSGAKLTGPLIGLQDDALLSFTNPEAMAMRDAVFEVAQRNLRVVLGAQFTAKEGEQLIARTYNPRLSEAENAKRIDRLMDQIKTSMEAKIDSAKYFEEHGTLRGWKGKMPSMADFDPAKDKGAPPPAEKAKQAPAPGFTKDGYRFKGGDPSQRMNWEPVK